MKATKIKIRNMLGIKETELDGSNVEIVGVKGSGKTSVIDAIRYALTNKSNREYIIKNGETESEILIETDTGLSIDRRKRKDKADYVAVKQSGNLVPAPESFLRDIFTPLQIDPVAFIGLSKKDQNRMLLDLIKFDWDLNWIKEQFGEIPSGVNYEQNILQVLNDIQSEDGDYFKKRKDINRDIRNKRAFVEDIAKDIPEGYCADTWEAYDVGIRYREIEKIMRENELIRNAKALKENYDNKIRGLQAEREISISSEEKAIASEREGLLSGIERMKAEIKANEDKLKALDGKLDDKKRIAESEYKEKVAILESNLAANSEYLDREPSDVAELQADVTYAEGMKKHLNEYRRMQTLQEEVDELKDKSDALTSKIELARNLPGVILETAKIPVEGLTVKDGLVLINGLPVSNLSDGQKLDLCVDVTLSKESGMQMILLDGVEKLDSKSRESLYKKCINKGVQFIATRTTDDELEVRRITA